MHNLDIVVNLVRKEVMGHTFVTVIPYSASRPGFDTTPSEVFRVSKQKTSVLTEPFSQSDNTTPLGNLLVVLVLLNKLLKIEHHWSRKIGRRHSLSLLHEN